MNATEFATRLNAKRNGNCWTARCPAHDDKNPSLSISEGREGQILLHCHAGCTTESIVAAMGLKMADLFLLREKERAQIIKSYDYTDATGKLLFQVVRLDPKDFRQRRPDPDHPGLWLWNMQGVQRVLYRLPRVIEAMKKSETIFIVEGEKDCHAAESVGLTATTNPGGAGKWETQYTETLRGADCIIISDADTPGRKHAELVAKSIYGTAKRVRILELPGNGKDISDFIENRDAQEPEGIRKEIIDLAEKAQEWMPAQPETISQTTAVTIPADKSKIYFNAGGKSFLAPDDRGGWIPMSETQVKRLLRNQGVESTIPRGEHVSEIDRELLKIQTTQNVDYAGPLAGHRAGIMEIENHRILVTESPRIIEPAPGEWNTLKTVMTGLLGDVQLPFLLGWIKIAYEALRAGKRMPGQALAIAGPRDCGKSLVQNLITPILGGRCARPYQFMTNGSPFNAHLFGAEHLMVEDEVPSTDLRARRAFGAQLKSITVNLEAQCHAKGQTPLILRPFWRLTITLNDEPENLMVLPPIDESIFDKITLLKANEQSMPMPTGTITEREAFWAKLISELPAFLAYLSDWQIPADIKSQRFGVTHYHHPDLVFALAELAPEHRLLSLVDGYLFGGMDQWTGTADELERELINDKSECRHEASKLFSFNTAAGTYLGRLAKLYPTRFETSRKENHRVWTIKSKECAE